MKLKTNDLAGQVETYILSFGPITFNTVIQFSLLKNENYDGIQLVDWFWCFNELRQIKQLRTVASPFLASRKQPAIILTLFHVSCLWWLLCNSRGWSQDDGGIGWREYFLPYKFIKRSFECWATSTEQLPNAGGGPQAPRKAAHSLQKEVGWTIKDQKRDKS